MIVDFFIAGTPEAEPRPRLGKNGHVYRPRGKGWREKVAWLAKAHAPEKPLVGPVTLKLRFCMPAPKGSDGRDYVFNAVPHVSKPDADNLAKNVTDSLTAAKFWLDDAQVYRLEAVKTYGEPVGVMITVVEES